LEALVHLTVPPDDYVLLSIEIPDGLAQASVSVENLPGNWRSFPAPTQLQSFGDRFIDSQEAAVLRVPSTVVPLESNYLLNPAHPDFGQIRIGETEPYDFDLRLFR
jgi:RES domain-containing protein